MEKGRFLFIFFLASFSLVLLSLPILAAPAPGGGAQLFFTPREGTFTVDSTFDVSILLDTGPESINTVDIKIEFPADKLQAASPSTGNSLISLWLQQPTLSNTNGIITFTGGVTGTGIRTSSGLISTITFRVKQPGQAVLKISSNSSILIADGLGTKTLTTFGRAVYNLVPKTPEGPVVFSVTHPDGETWYRNNNVIMGWDTSFGEASISYSYLLGREPSEIPDNVDDTTKTALNFPNLADGVWYFNIKQKQSGIYGDTTHYQLKIDTAPPAEFKPKVEIFTAALLSRKAMVTFFTTDALSGLNRYEVAVFDKSKEAGEAPIFIEASSPYRIADVAGGGGEYTVSGESL